MTSSSTPHLQHIQRWRSYLDSIKNRLRDQHDVADTGTPFQFPSCTWQCATNFQNTMLANLHDKHIEIG